MEKIINEIFLTLTNNYGVFGSLLIISLTLSVLYGFVSFIKQISGTVIKSRFSGRRNCNLKKHQTFKDLDFLMKHKLNDVNTTCPIRKKLYVDIMHERIHFIKKELESLISEDLNKLTSHEFYLRIKEVLDDAKNEAADSLKLKGVPDFVLNKVNSKLSVIQSFYKNEIKGYCYNEYLYANNNARMCAILDSVSVSLECYMNLLEESLSEFNGDIKTLNYGGVSCNNCQKCVHDIYLENNFN